MQRFHVVLVGLVLVVAASAQAVPVVDVRIDFSNKSPAPAVADQNAVAGTWNTVIAEGGPALALDYNTGLADTTVNGTITFTLGHTGSGSLSNDSSGNWNTANAGPSWLDSSKNAATDAMKGGNAVGFQLTFSNLDPNQLYDVEVVSSYKTSSYVDPANGLAYKAIGDTTVSYQWKAYTNGYVAGNWLSWLQFKPAANGTIIISSQGGVGSSAGIINAVRLYAVPEPATLLVMGLGLVGLLRRRS